MPGPLRTQQNIAVSQLLRPYPQYTTLTQTLIDGRGDHYQAIPALRAARLRERIQPGAGV